MPKGDQGDHWDFLAADLGAIPQKPESPAEEANEAAGEPESDVAAAQSEESPVCESAAQPEAEPQAEAERGGIGGRVVSGFGHHRGSVDWANLARELGVEALEEVPEPIPASETIGDRRPAFGETPVNEVTEPTLRSDAARLPSAEPAFLGFGAGILDEIEIVSPTEADRPPERVSSDAGETGEEEERRGRRRRRRRKPKGREHEESHGREAGEAGEAIEAIDQTVPEPAEAEDEEREEGRSHRRGRRRGSRRRPEREEDRAQDKVRGQSAEDAEAVEAFEDELEDHGGEAAHESDIDLDEDEADSTHGGKKIAHRGIPSWQETVGVIIDSNMEARSKRGDSGGGRYRPPRRRGDEKNGNRSRS